MIYTECIIIVPTISLILESKTSIVFILENLRQDTFTSNSSIFLENQVVKLYCLYNLGLLFVQSQFYVNIIQDLICMSFMYIREIMLKKCMGINTVCKVMCSNCARIISANFSR